MSLSWALLKVCPLFQMLVNLAWALSIVWPHLSEVKPFPDTIDYFIDRYKVIYWNICDFSLCPLSLFMNFRTFELHLHKIPILTESNWSENLIYNFISFSRQLMHFKAWFLICLSHIQNMTSVYIFIFQVHEHRGSWPAAGLCSSVLTKCAAVIYSPPCLCLLTVTSALPSWKVMYVNQLLTEVTRIATPEKTLCLKLGGECLETWPES